MTSIRDRNRERKRLQRERQRSGAIVYQTEDWQVFLDPDTLPQKAGCYAHQLPALVLKELVDNALDAGAEATIALDGNVWIVSDNGPGLDPGRVADLFAVNRPLRSSKLKRLPTRGMLGNGLRVVMAWARQLVVETHGARLTLRVDETTGYTSVTQREDIAPAPGLTVILPASDDDDGELAKRTLDLAECGFVYTGPSLPHWYGPEDLARLFRAAPADATVAEVISDLGLEPVDRVRSLPVHVIGDDMSALLREMQRQTKPIKPEQIGKLGPVYEGCTGYATKSGIAIERAGGHVPYTVEAHVEFERSKGAAKTGDWTLTVNRSATVAPLFASWEKDRLDIFGCGLHLSVQVPSGSYLIHLSIITPHIQLISDGKSPSLEAYAHAIEEVITKSARQAHRATQPDRAMSIKAAAWQAMPAAYMEASTNGELPANARQVMYAARGIILRLTGKDALNDQYFTQVLLPDYIAEHPEETARWDVVFDNRGTFIEPHTGRAVPLGTIEVREYLGERPAPETAATIARGSMFPTLGPQNRYRDILFVEKEGFTALLAHAQIAERFDIGVMSTKGLSVTAARFLIDKLMQSGVERVFVAHDFDVSGFSIFGTLGKSNRRYRFDSEARIVDIGLRLPDIVEMGLEREPSPNRNEKVGTWLRRVATLRRHGATPEEINFLGTDRVELNAMSSGVFVQFLERKLIEHGVGKVVPTDDVLERHARHVINRALLNKRLDAIRPEAEADAARLTLPIDLREQVETALQGQPNIPWDLAVAEIARRVLDGEDVPQKRRRRQ